jgi:hypothetical protein
MVYVKSVLAGVASLLVASVLYFYIYLRLLHPTRTTKNASRH